MFQIKLDAGLVVIRDVVFVLLLLLANEFGVVMAIGDRRQHGVGNMSNPAQARGLQGQCGRGNIHPHPTDHDRHQFFITKAQAEIINTFHRFLSEVLQKIGKMQPIGAARSMPQLAQSIKQKGTAWA